MRQSAPSAGCGRNQRLQSSLCDDQKAALMWSGSAPSAQPIEQRAKRGGIRSAPIPTPPMNYTLAFTDPLAARSELSGGKGANLALLTQRAFPVPPGFIVTARAYRDFVAGAAGLLRGVHRLPFDDAG